MSKALKFALSVNALFAVSAAAALVVGAAIPAWMLLVQVAASCATCLYMDVLTQSVFREKHVLLALSMAGDEPMDERYLVEATEEVTEGRVTDWNVKVTMTSLCGQGLVSRSMRPYDSAIVYSLTPRGKRLIEAAEGWPS